MARVKRAVPARKRRKAVLKRARGYYGNKSRTFRGANEQLMHSGQYAFRDRRARKGEFRKGLSEQAREVHVLRCQVRGDEPCEIRILHHIGQLGRLVAGVDGHRHGTSENRAEQQLDVLRAVGHQDANVIARRNAQRHQAARPLNGPLRKGGIGQRGVGKNQGVPTGKTFGGAEQQFAEGAGNRLFGWSAW